MYDVLFIFAVYVKLNTDGTIVNVLQSKHHTREIRESINFFLINTNVEEDGIMHILILSKYELFKALII